MEGHPVKASAIPEIHGDETMDTTRPTSWLNAYNKDYYGGGLMMLIGLGAAYLGLGYDVGTLNDMGPGYFPVVVGVILAAMGVLIAFGAKQAAPADGEENQLPEWRGWFCITGSIAAFILLGHYGGLVPATFAVVFISALGDRQNSIKTAFLFATAMVVVCVTVFVWALQMQFPLFRWG
jgi:hypothetical protein